MNPFNLPAGIAGIPQFPEDTPSLPKAPPIPGANLWDPGNRHKTLLALGAGLLSGNSLADGIGRAGANAMGLEEQLKAERLARRPQREYGGPDGAFEITTDPVTGERTVQPVKQFADYATAKRTKARDTADINGRAMAALLQEPEANRPAVYAAMLQHPDYYGIDPEHMPATYDPQYVANTAHMGMTVAQAQARETANTNAASLKAAREGAAADRAVRTNAYVDRSHALTSQGERRIGLSAAKAKTGGGRAKTSPHNSDLSYLLQ